MRCTVLCSLLMLAARERPPPIPPPDLGLVGGWPESDTLRLQGVLPARVHGQAVGVVASYVGLGPELARIDAATDEVDTLLVSNGGIATVLASQGGQQGDQILVGTAIDARVARWDLGGVEAPFPVGGAVAGTFIDEEPVIVYADGTGGCRIRFLSSDADHPFRVGCPLNVGLAVVGDAVLVALGPNGLWRATRAGVEQLLDLTDRADGVAYDDLTEQIVFWRGPDERVVAVTPSLEPLWDRRVAVRALAVLPGQGIVWAEPLNLGARLVLATVQGEPVEDIELDRPVLDLAAAPDGSRLGVRREADHASYTVLP